MIVDKKWMTIKYHEFNKKYFNDQLPTNIVFKTNTQVDRWGFAQCKYQYNSISNKIVTYDYVISMSNAYDSPEEIKENTLIHEMIHILDYKLHPEYYVYKDYKGWHRRKGYDAHGPLFFMKEAQRLSQYGFNIQRLVQAEEIDASQMTNKVQKRINNKQSKGFVIGCVYFNWKYPRNYQLKNECMWFKTSSPSTFNAIVEHEKEMNKLGMKDGQYQDFSIVGYLTHQDKYDEYSGCRGRISGWYCSTQEWEQMVQEMGNDKQLVGQFYFEDMLNENYSYNTEQPKKTRTLQDGENGIAKVCDDGAIIYRMM